jgi:hypothetical protein
MFFHIIVTLDLSPSLSLDKERRLNVLKDKLRLEKVP